MPTLRRVYRQGNSCVISIPVWALNHCGLEIGGYFTLDLTPGPAIVLKPHFSPPGGNGQQARVETDDEGTKPT